MKVYLAGPMTGYADYNFPAFHAAAALWRAEGWEVVNPAESFGGRVDLDRATYLRRDIEALLTVDAIAVLPGWQQSKGASMEVLIGRELGLPILDVSTFMEYIETAIEEAQRLVYGDRQAAYGHPLTDYTRTAALWTVILGQAVTAEQAILCMVAVKLSREVNQPKRDNRVDLIGYAACLDRVHERRGGRE